jgi:hypothetical protein
LQYFHDTLGKFWHPNRKIVDNHYKDIIPTFGSVERFDLQMSKTMELSAFIGYLTTWSGLNDYKKANPDKPDPLILITERQIEAFIHELTLLVFRMESIVGKNGLVTLTFPIFVIAVTQ